VVGGVFVAGGFVAREITQVRDLIARVLEFYSHGTLWLLLLITLLNGVAEELFFRGALYTALGGFYPVGVSTLLYIVATLASGNLMLGFAALVLGTVCALERRAAGGVLAAVLPHSIWGVVL